MVFDPYGELVAETKGWKEEVLYFWFLPERVREWRSNPFFPGRALHPEIYQRHFSKSQKLED
jgi:predicted amidohydrolase